MTTVSTGAFMVDVQEWSLLCQASQATSSGWACSLLHPARKWPLNIVLHEGFFEKCATLFGLIFPLKLAEYCLDGSTSC